MRKYEREATYAQSEQLDRLVCAMYGGESYKTGRSRRAPYGRDEPKWSPSSPP